MDEHLVLSITFFLVDLIENRSLLERCVIDYHQYFSLCSLQKTCFNALHLQAVQRRIKNMRQRMAEDLWQRFVSKV